MVRTAYKNIYMVECVANDGSLVFRRYTYNKTRAVKIVANNSWRLIEGDYIGLRRLERIELSYLKNIEVEE